MNNNQITWALREGIYLPGIKDESISLSWLKDNASGWSNFSTASSGSQHYSFEEFDSQLREAVRNTVPKDKSVGVLLSGGKDSTSLLYAMYREGYTGIKCFTYLPERGENETLDAANLCAQLGYEHCIVESDLQKDYSAWLSVLSSGDNLNLDFAFPAVCRLAKVMADLGVEVVVDGMGNDLYMGHIPPRIESYLKKLSIVPYLKRVVWGREIHKVRFLAGWKFMYLLSSILMHPIERMLPGSRLSISEINELGLDSSALWRSLEDLTSDFKGMSEQEQRACFRGLIFDDFGAMGKSRAAMRAFDMEAVFPYVESSFCHYYSSLLENDRYDWKTRKNKVALRKYLSDVATVHGVNALEFNTRKGSFRFNFDDFINSHRFKLLSFLDQEDGRKEYDLITSKLKNYLSKENDYYDASKAFLLASVCIHLAGRKCG